MMSQLWDWPASLGRKNQSISLLQKVLIGNCCHLHPESSCQSWTRSAVNACFRPLVIKKEYRKERKERIKRSRKWGSS